MSRYTFAPAQARVAAMFDSGLCKMFARVIPAAHCGICVEGSLPGGLSGGAQGRGLRANTALWWSRCRLPASAWLRSLTPAAL